MIKVECPQWNKTLEVEPSDNLLALLVRHGLPVGQSCAGAGVCGTCRVRIVGTDLPPLTSHLKLAEKQGVPRAALDSVLRFACLVDLANATSTARVSTNWKIFADHW